MSNDALRSMCDDVLLLLSTTVDNMQYVRMAAVFSLLYLAALNISATKLTIYCVADDHVMSLGGTDIKQTGIYDTN